MLARRTIPQETGRVRQELRHHDFQDTHMATTDELEMIQKHEMEQRRRSGTGGADVKKRATKILKVREV